MPPKMPEQMETQEERERRQRLAVDVAQPRREINPQAAQAVQPKPQQPSSLYMGPPEAQTQVEAEPFRPGPTGFVGFGQLQAANLEAASRMAGAAAEAAKAQGNVGLLQTEEGRQALLRKAFGSASDVDAALAGAAGADYFAQLEAAYGPAAQARAERLRAEASKRAVEAQAAMGREAQRLAKAQAARTAEQAIQDEIKRLQQYQPRGGRRGSEVRSMTPEQWANLHGMTLEQWVRGGKNPPF